MSGGSVTKPALASGEVELRIESPETLTGKQKMSPVVYIANLPWTISIAVGKDDGEKGIGVYVFCNSDSDSKLWRCTAAVDFLLFLVEADGYEHALMNRVLEHEFPTGNKNSLGRGFPHFVSNDGYLNKNKILLRATITVRKVIGVEFRALVDFSVARPASDTILAVGGKKFHVSKGYLSEHSPVFERMLLGEYKEKGMEEVPIEDVDPADFEILLHAFHPAKKAVTAENVELLLALGDRFDVKAVREACTAFLIESKDVTVDSKLVWSDKYCLSCLQDAVLKNTKSGVLKAFTQKKEYNALSADSRISILEKLVKIL